MVCSTTTATSTAAGPQPSSQVAPGVLEYFREVVGLVSLAWDAGGQCKQTLPVKLAAAPFIYVPIREVPFKKIEMKVCLVPGVHSGGHGLCHQVPIGQKKHLAQHCA